MSQKSRYNRERRERSPQQKLLSKVGRIQKQAIREREQEFAVNYNDEPEQGDGEEANIIGSTRRSIVNEQIENIVNNLPTSESYDIIRYDEEPPPSEPQETLPYFSELYGQETDLPVGARSAERYAGKKQSGQRSDVYVQETTSPVRIRSSGRYAGEKSSAQRYEVFQEDTTSPVETRSSGRYAGEKSSAQRYEVFQEDTTSPAETRSSGRYAGEKSSAQQYEVFQEEDSPPVETRPSGRYSGKSNFQRSEVYAPETTPPVETRPSGRYSGKSNVQRSEVYAPETTPPVETRPSGRYSGKSNVQRSEVYAQEITSPVENRSAERYASGKSSTQRSEAYVQETTSPVGIRSAERYASGKSNVQRPEEYIQETASPVRIRSSERNAGGRATGQRSRSVPPSSEFRNKVESNVVYDDEPLDTVVYNTNSGDVIAEDFIRQDNLVERGSRLNAYVEDVQSRGRSPTKKVSYAQEAGDTKLSGTSGNKQATSSLQYRFRADNTNETDDSDLSFTVANPTARKSASPSPSAKPPSTGSPQASNKYYSYPPPASQTNSDRSFIFDAQSADDFVNRNNNYRLSNRYSQDSIPGIGGVSSSYSYGKDVLPLPIEIPDNVADAEAFRRYLSVRRGAILTPVRHQNISFEKRNQSSASYESLGRKPRKGPGLTPSGQLGQEASRRTSSLSHAIMTLALLSASICQLRFLITYSHAHSYPILNYFLVFTSIILEVAAGIGYVLIARCSYDDVQSEAIHNYLIFALFIVAVSNVILAAFAFDDHLCDELKLLNSHTSSPTTSQDQQFSQSGSRSDRVMDLRYMPLE